MTTEDHHPLHTVPHDLIGRAIKDIDFRHAVLDHKDDMTALNDYLVEQGYAPVGQEAFDAIHALSATEVDEVLEDVTFAPEVLAS